MIERVDNLTGVRAFAALWVLSIHISFFSFAGRLGTLANRGNIGVDVFFVLSGFVLSVVYTRTLPRTFRFSWYKRFVSRRFAKLYPLHLLTLLLLVLIVPPARHFGHHVFVNEQLDTAWTAVCQLLMLNACGLIQAGTWNPPAWSVGAEWFAYTVLFAPMVFLLRRVRVLWIVLAVAVLWCSLFLLILCLRGYNPDHLLSGAGIVRITPEFLAGYALFRVIQRGSRKHGDLWTVCGLVSLLAITFGPLPGFALVLLPICAILRGAHDGGRLTDRIFGNRWAVRLGEASYSLYLMHMFVIAAANLLLRHSGLQNSLGRAAVAGAALVEAVAAIGVALVTFHYVEEPLRQWLVYRLSAARENPEARGSGNSPSFAPDTEISATIG